MALYVLFETATGYGLFEAVESEDVALPEIQKSILDLQRFGSMVKLKAFAPFANAEMALENINAVSEGTVTDFLKNFLEQNLPTVKKSSSKKPKFVLGVQESKIGGSLQEELNYACENSSRVSEIVRGIRAHFVHYVKGLQAADMNKAQLGLSHGYSRAKVKFNVNRVDNMIIQSIALLDQLDKDLNTFAMRVREWYGWHFPELSKIVTDNYMYARVASAIKNRKSLLDTATLDAIKAITCDDDMAMAVLEASKCSMGTEISEIDMIHVERFAAKVVDLSVYRKQLFEYLQKKMNACAPNLTALIGELVGARLISHAGSLTNLAKAPASTVQILGAEKALFRALKTKGNTPKYGLIFHSSFIGKAAPKNKGRISRYLANKCSMASRIDSFSDEPTDAYGNVLRKQVEERLEFYSSGTAPRKNVDVMAEVAKVLAEQHEVESEEKMVVEEEQVPEEKEEEQKKKKKSKKRSISEDAAEEPVKKKSKSKEKKEKTSVKKSKKKVKKAVEA